MEKDRTRDPRKDKDLSLRKDRRNTYGEAPHAARKAIPKRKRLAHKASRGAARQALAVYDRVDEEQQDVIASDTRQDVYSVGSWKKQPDSPLGRQVELGQAQRKFKSENPQAKWSTHSEQFDSHYDNLQTISDKWEKR